MESNSSSSYPFEVQPLHDLASERSVAVTFSASNRVVGDQAGAFLRQDVTFSIRFADYTEFASNILFRSVAVGVTERTQIMIPAKDILETYAFWYEVIGGVTVRRNASVSINDRTMSSRPHDVGVGWGLTTVQGLNYERVGLFMY